MEELANGRVNDAVKLAFLGSGLPPEQWERIDALELEELAEFKRSGNGRWRSSWWTAWRRWRS